MASCCRDRLQCIWPGCYPALTYVVSLSTPIFMLRTILWPLPTFLATVAVGVALVPSRRVIVAAIALIMAVQGAALSNYYSYPVKGEPWDEVVHLIQANNHRPTRPWLPCRDCGLHLGA